MGSRWSLTPGGHLCFPAASLSGHPWACSVPWPSATCHFLNFPSRPWVLPVARCWLWGSEAGGAASVVPRTELGRQERSGMGHPSFCPGVLYESLGNRDLLPPRPPCIFSAPSWAGGRSQRPAVVCPGGPLLPVTPETIGRPGSALCGAGPGPHYPPSARGIEQEGRGPQCARPRVRGGGKGRLARAPCCNAALS